MSLVLHRQAPLRERARPFRASRPDRGHLAELRAQSARLNRRGGGLAERLSAKYGMTLEQAKAANARVAAAAAGEGLDFHLDVARPGNTFDAHRLIHLAKERGVQAQAKERLMAAYFNEGRRIGDPETLVELIAA